MQLAKLSDVAVQALVLAIVTAPSLIGFGLGSLVAAKLLKRLLRSRHVMVWSLCLILSLVWMYSAYLYGSWLYTFMVRSGRSVPAAGADIFGLIRGAFLYGPFGALVLGPSVVAFVVTIRTRPQDFSTPRFVLFLLDQLRGPNRLYWWTLTAVLAAVLVRIIVLVAIEIRDG